MKYYLYKSQSKIDMLFPQINNDDTKEITTKIGGDSKIIKYERTKRIEKSINDYKKIEIIVDHLRNNEKIGAINSDKEWFYGKLQMNYFMLPSEDFVYFTVDRELSDNLIIGLGGSTINLIGNDKVINPESMNSMTVGIFRRLGFALNNRNYNGNSGDIYQRVYEVTCEMRRFSFCEYNTNQVEFVAKKLTSGTIKDKIKILIGSPLYVALDD